MPNTLAHFGLQAITTKLLFRSAPCKWIALGCILPDLPWIGQRLLACFLPNHALLGLRLYCMIQASFFFCLILSAALTLLLTKSKTIFLLLALNSLVHLLLDAVQIKWANGVHLFAPFSWKLTSFSLFWPESPATYLITTLGLLLFLLCLLRLRLKAADNPRPPGKASQRSGWILLLLYLLLPLALFPAPLQENCHFTQTLQDRSHRKGKYIEVDRCHYTPHPRAMVHIFTGETIRVQGPLPSRAGVISLQGRFTTADTIQISRYHVHSRFRDLATLAGLVAALLLWVPDLSILIRTSRKTP